MEYRFRTVDSRGTISIAGDLVCSNVAQGFTKWSFETPLNKIHPNPVRSTSVPSLFWLCFLLGGVGIATFVWQFLEPSEMPDPYWIHYVSLLLSIGVFLFSFVVRREEWIAFPTELDSIWIRYSRSGPDRRKFEEFTAELCKRIEISRRELELTNS